VDLLASDAYDRAASFHQIMNSPVVEVELQDLSKGATGAGGVHTPAPPVTSPLSRSNAPDSQIITYIPPEAPGADRIILFLKDQEDSVPVLQIFEKLKATLTKDTPSLQADFIVDVNHLPKPISLKALTGEQFNGSQLSKRVGGRKLTAMATAQLPANWKSL